MKLAVNVGDKNTIKKLIDKNVSNIIIGLKDFCCRFNNAFDIDEIKDILLNKKNTEISVCINDIIFEDKIPLLLQNLKSLEELKVDWVIFHDFAIPQLVYENNLNLKLHYNPETIVTSYGQFEFYLKNNIKRVTLASELMFLEMKKICANKQEMEVFVKGYGLGFVMHSRWPMLSNFLKYDNIESKKFNEIKYWKIKEDLRMYPNIIYEDQFGTHMMTGYNICGLKRINEFKEVNLDYMYIDSLFMKEEELLKIVDIFNNAINNELSDEELSNQFEMIKTFSELEVTEAFFGKLGDIWHTKKVDENVK